MDPELFNDLLATKLRRALEDNYLYDCRLWIGSYEAGLGIVVDARGADTVNDYIHSRLASLLYLADQQNSADAVALAYYWR